MNLSAIRTGKTAAQRTAEDAAKRTVAHANSGMIFRNVSPTTQAAIVAKAAAVHSSVKPGVNLGLSTQTPTTGSLDAVAAVAKAFTDGIAAMTAAIRGPAVQKAPPTPAHPPVTQNTALSTVAKRARVADIAAEEARRAPQRATKVVLSPSGNAPYVPLETEGQRRRSRDDAVAAQRSMENAAADRVLVSKGGARVLALRALDPSLSANALVVLAYILRKWNEADRRPVRVRASDASGATGLTTVEAQAALDELETARATIVAINSVGTRLIQPGLGVAGE